MGISQYIKEIGRGARGAKPLTRAQAADLFGQVLDGAVTDLEVGAFCLAMRIKGETAEEMCGFLDATHQRLTRFPASERPLVVLPSYNGARRLPVLTPLLALLLARAGLPVLLHGMRTEARRVLACDVLDALGIPALDAPERIAAGAVCHIHTRQLHGGLARLLAVREVVGLRNPGHSTVKLMNPCAGPAVVVSSYTHPEYFGMLQATFCLLGMTALLSRGLEGEVVADPRRSARSDGFVHGVHGVLQAQQPGTTNEVPGLPTALDVASTATYTRRVLAGELPVPPAIGRQVEHILQLADRTVVETLP
ncbi:DNA-binding protein YbiB [Verminephrobacter aporrectodeae]|uniref:DNA-binding protein YbiB n=2 Tax=Verminephrobacter TaxID=364316 RepID=A0ABT3KSM9_9BURK|nr:DNA-binding protein YbiB [Verminephrobacter aporrectodeae]MCW5222294.1 DNA-binding protein YbiB [Verminephrobacter aporrectodeae subsp. tuberculatae]MCW5257494.1 DNA-binding protein YbiB [Verminephrobacter aporrectodeae subsp. tuberculatae]MCW5287758.1 DNA-binding protein YbiB [Verminephrobacter aporrectodeae subsp. tuberculatae]MCW5321323.1 DNA-binding protein YbiB [Verminephrobacter aporrectodeae subsp. tuberculatae]MCW8167049.1 DNA-binding protein YbiB [Verminephrobacter aporrectodeae su